MTAVSIVAGFLLAIVFIVSGLGKLRDRPGSREAMVEFGLPGRLVPAAALLLPVTELVVAALLVVPGTRVWGAEGALLLLLSFIAAIGWNMSQGRHPECHCFGQIHSEPAGWSTIGRNLVLLIPASIIVAGDNGQQVARSLLDDLQRTSPMLQAGSGVVATAVAAVAVMSVMVLREDQRLELRLETLARSFDGHGLDRGTIGDKLMPRALPVGALAPGFTLPMLDGTEMSLSDLQSTGKITMLVFVDPTCGPCGQLLRELPAWQTTLSDSHVFVVVSRGTVTENRAKPGMMAMDHVVMQQDRELSYAYGILGTPSAVLIAADGTIAAPVTGGIAPIRLLLANLEN